MIRGLGENATNVQQEMRTAPLWITDFLRDQGCSTGRDIAEKFGLWRVRYKDNSQIARICRRHLSIRAYEVWKYHCDINAFGE
ncbi:hypothetical protein RJ641_034698 [Dillenia turbinata]|uniref:Uncharacterized protein n=1 Tax=Dillenia turbinata TaxID=194707 RepID=A0AAN8VUX1_9MAGN